MVGGGGFLEGFLVGDKVSWRLGGGVPVVYGVICNRGYDTRLGERRNFCWSSRDFGLKMLTFLLL